MIQRVQRIWRLGAPLAVGCGYHSVAILMKDGRVFVGGGEPRAVSEAEFEIYTPDCLLRGPRPSISLSKSRVAYGETLSIRLGKQWEYRHLHPDRIALLRCCTATHAFNFDQRYVNLPAFRKRRRYIKDGKDFRVDTVPIKRLELVTDEPILAPHPTDREFDVIIPDNSNLLPPGYYFLFVSSRLADGSTGAPCVAEIIQIC